MAEKKEKKYVSNNAQLMAEWNWEKNNELGFDPNKLTCGSHSKVWWKCSKGHEWEAMINNKNKGRGCPYCAGKKVLKGYNDLQTINSDLANEWNYEKNNELTPMDVTASSSKKVWWICDKGHEWQTTISHRSTGQSCPYCARQKVIKGHNDLQTVNPTLANEWNYEKNNGLTPSDIMPNSEKKVWWKCSKGHEWQSTVAHRNNGRGCPICSSERNTSLPEYTLLYYLRKYGLDAVHSYKGQGYELDVYIPSKKIAIEYDGYYWHRNKLKIDLEKNLKCKKDGIKLYRIREALPLLNSSSIDYVGRMDQKDLSIIIEAIIRDITGIDVDIDTKRDYIDIENLREHTEKENSLLVISPALAKEWNYERNRSLKPENFTANSGRKIWWKCSKGHEWQATIASRNRGNGCPYCSDRKVLIGYNDLSTTNPTLAKEWNYEKNHNINPTMVAAGSVKKIWWKCSEGHEWQAEIRNRTKGNGCPYCSGNKVLAGYNDLLTLNPDLAKEWNKDRNAGLTPEHVTPNSDKKVWWKCAKGHEWQSTIGHRNKGRGCPFCAKEKRKTNKKNTD